MGLKAKKLSFMTAYGYLLACGGFLGFLASMILTIDKMKLLADPSYVPDCNINPIISCGSVMVKEQASVFGFTNSLIGVASFAAICAVGAAILAGATFKRWFWLGLQLAVTLAICFIGWLFFQSVYELNTLCPYCLVVWIVTIPIFWYTTLGNLHSGAIPIPIRMKSAVAFLKRHHADILVAWYLLIICVILNHFWYYWSTLL